MSLFMVFVDTQVFFLCGNNPPLAFSVCRAVLVQPPLTSQGFNSVWHLAVVTQGSLFCTKGVWLFAVTIEATRGLKGCGADWEMGHIICPWNVMWHNTTLGYLYVKVNISAWQFNKSRQGACQCGFILCAVKEVLWHRVAVGCRWDFVCVCRASVHKFNPHKAQASWTEKVFVWLVLFCALPAMSSGKLMVYHRKRDWWSEMCPISDHQKQLKCCTTEALAGRGNKTSWRVEGVLSCISVRGNTKPHIHSWGEFTMKAFDLHSSTWCYWYYCSVPNLSLKYLKTAFAFDQHLL